MGTYSLSLVWEVFLKDEVGNSWEVFDVYLKLDESSKNSEYFNCYDTNDISRMNPKNRLKRIIYLIRSTKRNYPSTHGYKSISKESDTVRIWREMIERKKMGREKKGEKEWNRGKPAEIPFHELVHRMCGVVNPNLHHSINLLEAWAWNLDIMKDILLFRNV